MYLPVDQDQPDSYCCVPTTASMIVDHGSAGMKRPAVERLRQATGVPHPNGISYLDIEAAVQQVANVDLQSRFLVAEGTAAIVAASGRSFGISIDASVTRYTARRTGTFTGGHTVYVRGYSVWPGGGPCACEKKSSLRHSEFTVQDPGTFSVGFQQWSASLLLKAAQSRTGGRGINIIVGLDTTDVWRKRVKPGYVRESPSTGAKALRRIEDRPYNVVEIVNGESYTTPAGHTSTGWYRIAAGGFIRGDRLGTVNVEKP